MQGICGNFVQISLFFESNDDLINLMFLCDAYEIWFNEKVKQNNPSVMQELRKMNSFKCTIGFHDYTEWSEIYYIGTNFGKLGVGYRKYRNRKCKCCGWVQEKLVDKRYYS